MFQFGIDRVLNEAALQARLKGKRLALLGHPASVTSDLTHSLDALMAHPAFHVVAAFGPQHGMRGEKQDNMIESDDYQDPHYKIPVYSLYGRVRRPTPEMMQGWDILLIDLQDVGCRIYTFLTTLFYMMEELRPDQEIWVLDRPNPAGRPVEGHSLDMNFASFVGAAPIVMRHGLTLGEAALWYKDLKKLKCTLEVVAMKGYRPEEAPLHGWVNRSWVNPSPNMPRLSTARCYAGTVLLEGTLLSEGRGTTIPLEIFGAPGLKVEMILKDMHALAPEWFRGCKVRSAFFEPTFHKFKGELCAALQIHVDGDFYDPDAFKPYRLINLFLKSVRRVHPDFKIFRDPPYEYETVKMPIDILSGHNRLREWVENPQANVFAWHESLLRDEDRWRVERKPFLLY